MQIRVYYEDTDLGGVVYHSNYLNFCERARSELFFKHGETPVLQEGHFVAKSIKADYLASAKFADALHVTTQTLTMKGASFTLLQQIYRDETLLFRMEITLAFVNHEGKLTRMSEGLKSLLKRLI